MRLKSFSKVWRTQLKQTTKSMFIHLLLVAKLSRELNLPEAVETQIIDYKQSLIMSGSLCCWVAYCPHLYIGRIGFSTTSSVESIEMSSARFNQHLC